MTTWSLEIDGREYAPIPSTWIDHGSDRDHGEPRVVDVNVAHSVRDLIRIRYVTVDGDAYVVRMSSRPNPTNDGCVPAPLARYKDWPRSIVPTADVDADDARDLELEHLIEIWSDVIDDDKEDGASDGWRIVADGGPERLEIDVDARTALRHALQKADHEREIELNRQAVQLDITGTAPGGNSR